MGSVQAYSVHMGAQRHIARLTQIMRDLLCWSVDHDPADRPGSRRRVSRPLRRLACLAPGAQGRAGVLAGSQALPPTSGPCPLERDLSSFPCFLRQTCCGNIGSGGLKHDPKKLSELKRGRLVAGWLHGRWSVHPFDLAPRKAAVLGNLNQPGLFELGQVVVKPVRCHADPLCQFFGGLGSSPQAFEQANSHGIS